MQIANPIYDVVFKYLLEDSESAILLLSAIIDQPIETLEFLPQEGSSYLKNHSLTVYRIDFSAKINHYGLQVHSLNCDLKSLFRLKPTES